MTSDFNLEAELCSKLTDPWPAGSVGDNAKVHRILQIAIGIGKVNRVKDIKHVKAEFEAHSLINPCIFGKAKINPSLHRAAKGVPSETAEAAARTAEAAPIYHGEVGSRNLRNRIRCGAVKIWASETGPEDTARSSGQVI